MSYHTYTISLISRQLLLCIWVLAPIYSQAQWGDRGIAPMPQSVVLDENFTDEGSSAVWQTWSQGQPHIYEENGRYTLSADKENDLEHWLPLSLTPQDDYELDLSLALRHSGQSLHNAYGFIFGTTPEGGRLAFMLGNDGQYAIQELDSRGDAFVWQYDHVRGLVPYRFHQFIVRKIGSQVTFSVDGEHIYEWQQQAISGSKVGLVLGKGASVMVDHIRVIRLSKAQLPTSTIVDIYLESPSVAWYEGHAYHTSPDSLLELQGHLSTVDTWLALWIDEIPVTVADDGSFSAKIGLKEGDNTVSMKVLLKDGSQINRYLTVQHLRPSIDSVVSHGHHEKILAGDGRNFLVLIGVNQYNHWNNLHNAVKDCEDVARTLMEFYQFEPNYVRRLYDQQATRVGIIETMEWLQDEMRPQDNLLIYYAGHGYFDEFAKLGYWVPADGKMDRIPDYIPNSTIHDYLGSIDTKHTLLIADACYAGSLLGGSRGYLSAQLKSRWVFASGEIERVYDGAPGSNSPFADEMIQYLRENKNRPFLANELIDRVSVEVSNRVQQHPVGSPLLHVGDAGGAFPFVPKGF